MSTKKFFMTITILFILLTSLTSFVLANNASNGINALNITNNQVVYKGKVLTSTPEIKQFACLSPDGQKIAFAYKMDLTQKIWGKIGIIQVDTGKITDIFLDDNYANAFINVQWVSDKQVAITGHRNPSLNTYEVYDINSLKLANKYYGIGFTWNKLKTHLYYTIPAPHFTSGDRGKNKIVNELGDILYESASDTIILGGPSFSDTEGKVAFFERELSTHDTSIIVSSVQADKKLNTLKRIKWDDAVGDIIYNSDGTINVKSKFKDVKYDIENQKVLKTDYIQMEKKFKPDAPK